MAVFMFGRSKPFSAEANFSENTWAEIIKACQMNKVPDTWLVGDNKLMTINGMAYQIDIIGKNHDTYSDGTGKAPLTLQLHGYYDTAFYRMNDTLTNAGGWRDCAMRSTHLPTILAQMPEAVRSGIRQVNKMTSEGNLSSTIITTADTLFLLAEIEVLGVKTFSNAGEGTQYAYYKEGNSAVKTMEVTSRKWFTRSPVYNSQYNFSTITEKGAPGSENANYPLAVSFAFCF